MIYNLEFIENVFKSNYAPTDWKKQHFGWDVNEESKKAKEKIYKAKNIHLKEFHQILKDFFLSARDYHVGVNFISTEHSSLAFEVRGFNGKYYFVYIDREQLPFKYFPIHIGDEILMFDGKPVNETIQEIKLKELRNDGNLHNDGNDKTDQTLSEIFLTFRYNQSISTPKGPINILAKSADSGKIVSCQTYWNYEPEKIKDITRRQIPALTKKKTAADFLSKKNMTPSFWANFRSLSKKEHPHMLGARKSFVPILGNLIWESPPSNPFYAYLFRSNSLKNKTLAYIRIPHYTIVSGDEIKEFAKIVKYFESKSDALIIDQVNNPGGSVFYLYALASMLTTKDLNTPKHRMCITQQDVFESIEILPELQNIKNDKEAINFFGNEFEGYPITYKFVQFCVNYFQFIINEWNKGKSLTEPHHIFGVDKISPSSLARYSKPILILTNELDFSGGDFFPAIFQDNRRAKILGTNTAGAGGYVNGFSYPNNLGIGYLSFTGSIAERINKNPIENLGIQPDIEYHLDQEDFQGNYKKYLENILLSLSKILN